ncbi:hypothetical protein V6Z11_D04G024500 [Gossypium hirsutum]
MSRWIDLGVALGKLKSFPFSPAQPLSPTRSDNKYLVPCACKLPWN